MGYEYTFYERADAPELTRLWADQTDWGESMLGRLNDWFARAPFGPPHIVVATDADTGNIVGQFRFMPTRVLVDGREVPAVRPFGTIVSPEMRTALTITNPLSYPPVAMYLRAKEEVANRGAVLVHMVPDPRW